ncbi:MAG: hypothetical protein KAT15_07400 [Bacteroidales bacterium]|nr:hypothetical protein [Bacteroidales bacterium]
MKASFEVKKNVIIRRFKGTISHDDMLNSWKELFERYDNLSQYKGIITTFEGRLPADDPGAVKAMVQLLNENKEKLKGLRVAIVLDHPMITNAVMVDHYVKHVQIRPFVTETAAMRWVSP